MKRKIKNYNTSFKLEENIILQLFTCLVLCSIVIMAFFIINNRINLAKFREYSIVEDIKLKNSIEKYTVDSDNISIEGYAFMLDKNSSDNLISVFIRNIITKKEIWLEIKQYNRMDLDSYYKNEYEYINSGFVATTKSKELDFDEVYEIIINIDYKEKNEEVTKRKTVSTNQYILGSEIYSYNPLEFDRPDMSADSKLLREVFTNGRLCFYQKEEGIYVYQYEGKLYWITTENFVFDQKNATYIIYHLYTTQINGLPDNRIQHGFDNLDFIFEKFEYKDENTAPYRIAIRDIPEEYPITYISSGVYDREVRTSYWRKNFYLKTIK